MSPAASADSKDMPPIITVDHFKALSIMGSTPTNAPVAVAVSGGPDSMALCYFLSQWALHSGAQIHAITVDHGLREDAATEARQVDEWLADWPNVKHIILTRDAKETQSRTRVMEEARHDRYAMMAEYCTAHNIERLFVAHHRDDQAETFLFRLAKGSGLDGLSCMNAEHDYSDTLKIMRPFLVYTKDTIVKSCAEFDIPYITDPSNENEAYARPRLRKAAEILAEEGLTVKRLSVTASRLARAKEALEHYTNELLAASIVCQDSDTITLEYKILATAPPEIRLRVLLRGISLFNPDKNYAPRMERCEDLEARIFEEKDFHAATLGGVIFRLDLVQKHLLLEKEKSL
jgi:tRNA(Ile)-lysidine synthase